MKIVAVIPARYQSSRFPGKPLVDINGKPMVWWVYHEAKKVKAFDRVIVATESDVVMDKCKELGMECMMTSDDHPTGTDRVAEVAQKVPADIYCIIMGDEPMIRAEDEEVLISKIKNAPNADAIMLTEKFSDPVDVVNMTTIKLAISDSGYLIFMSRMPIPYPKETLGYPYYKNVGCYAIRKDTLDFYLKTKPGACERAEGIELLRLLENHKKVMAYTVDSKSMAVDTPKDLERVKEYLASINNTVATATSEKGK